MFSIHIPSKGAKSIADMLIYADDAELAVNIHHSGEKREKVHHGPGKVSKAYY